MSENTQFQTWYTHQCLEEYLVALVVYLLQ